MERRRNTYQEFQAIIENDYSPEKILLLNVAADRMFAELDNYVASGLECDDEDLKVFDYEVDMDWDFPDPPNFSRWDCA